ncbi:CYTH-like domain-containing protein [Cladorrhinum sp. PSN259]|nr:CYTH-like domain-containing protein [Cladorrhinum sp. PSN259]
MDLRGILNDGPPAAASRPSQPPQPPPLQQQQQQPHHQPIQPRPPPLPSTPIQTNPQQSFRDYSQGPPQHSPTRHVSQDYGGGGRPSVAFASPTQYHQAGPYASRPAPPPIQPMPPAELRSPSVGSGQIPHSPYQQTPTSSISTPGGYPFPPQHQHHHTPTSPVSRHQYPPASAYPRDIYGQPPAVAGMTGPSGGAPYMQSSQVPQTPPIGTPGAHHAYINRSQSTHSTPTPTSAHSQSAQYGPPFGHGSPVATPHPLPQADSLHQRQLSQPPTPGGGPPISARPAQVVGYGPPSSPYQQRMSAGTFHPTSQTSPPPPPPPLLPRHSSAQSLYDPPTQDPPRGPLPPQSDRGQSLSVSPKTRVPSLPSSSGRPGSSVSDSNHQQHHVQFQPPPPNMATILEMDIKLKHDRASTPAKRKLDERELRPDEMEKRDTRPPPFKDTNGRPPQADAAPPAPSRPSLPIKKEIKKRRIYPGVPPIWAQTQQALQGRPLKHANATLYRPVPHSTPQVNGRTEAQASRHASPEEKRSIAPRETSASQASNAPPPDPFGVNYFTGPLGHWEPSITNTIPPDSIVKTIADFLFHYVVANPHHEEMMARNVKFEIEAKLGTLIENPSKMRIRLPVESECVLSEGFAFRSSMTETQHRAFNGWLNQLVQDVHPDNPNNKRIPNQPARVPIQYLHRREVDKFIEIPAEVRDRYLPECILNLSSNKAPRIRITQDQKTDKVLARIVKARVADASLHMPKLPFDCRISVNLEWEWDGPVEELDRLAAAVASRGPIHQRNKDRLSYTHCFYQVDLTQVTSPGNSSKEHELEVEVDPNTVIDQGRRAQGGQPHLYLELVSGLVNNIRVLAQKAAEDLAKNSR